MGMISLATVSMSPDMVASSRCQALNYNLTERAVSSTARINSYGPSDSPCWMHVVDSMNILSANSMLGLLQARLVRNATLGTQQMQASIR